MAAAAAWTAVSRQGSSRSMARPKAARVEGGCSTASSPVVTASVTVTVCPAGSALASVTLTPLMALVWLCWTMVDAGPESTGGALPSVTPRMKSCP